MTCDEAEILLHALIDGELDAGHARDVETHVAACPACADKLQAFRAMRETMAQAHLKQAAPAHLRNRIEAALAVPAATISVRANHGWQPYARLGKISSAASLSAPHCRPPLPRASSLPWSATTKINR